MGTDSRWNEQFSAVDCCTALPADCHMQDMQNHHVQYAPWTPRIGNCCAEQSSEGFFSLHATADPE